MRKSRALSAKATAFVALDGEAVNDAYIMMADSLGNVVYHPAGLSTQDCLEFILRPRLSQRHALVMFGMNYDVNMLLRDLPERKRTRLWVNGECLYTGPDGRSYWLEWIPAKLFKVSRYASEGASNETTTVSDVWGIFQSSFVRALERWEIPADEAIARMKGERANFTLEQVPEIREYCIEECKLLVRLMRAVATALDDVGISTHDKWHGAGAIAAGLMSKYRVQRYKVDDVYHGEEPYAAIMHAYFGGRVEAFKLGAVGDCTTYDVRSAYPYAATLLPSLRAGQWAKTEAVIPGYPYALYHVRWDTPNAVVCPFPFRHKRQIQYPDNGEGIYWAYEIEAALEHYPDIEVIEGCVFIPSEHYLPFEFLHDIYRDRNELKQRGHAGEKVLKLGMNSVYGKLAQGLSAHGTPPYQSYLWAGLITSWCRAQVFQAAMTAPESIVMIATDGLVFDGPVSLPVGGNLGELEAGEIRDCFVAQPGVYCGEIDGEFFGKTRGFFQRDIDWQAMREGWERDGIYYTQAAMSRRFIGMGGCYVRRSFDLWRTWHEQTRVIRLYPSRKFPRSDMGNSVKLNPPHLDSVFVSEEYVPKSKPASIEDDAEYLQGLDQPLQF